MEEITELNWEEVNVNRRTLNIVSINMFKAKVSGGYLLLTKAFETITIIFVPDVAGAVPNYNDESEKVKCSPGHFPKCSCISTNVPAKESEVAEFKKVLDESGIVGDEAEKIVKENLREFEQVKNVLAEIGREDAKNVASGMATLGSNLREAARIGAKAGEEARKEFLKGVGADYPAVNKMPEEREEDNYEDFKEYKKYGGRAPAPLLKENRYYIAYEVYGQWLDEDTSLTFQAWLGRKLIGR